MVSSPSGAPFMSTDMPGHLTGAVIAGYLDGALSEHERSAAETHLADCDSCRADTIAAGRVARSHRSARPQRRWLMAPLAAAVATLLVFAPARSPLRDEGASTRLREESARVTERTPAIAALHPTDGSLHSASPSRFTWASAGPDAIYRLTLSDAAGRTVWATAAGDTVVAMPPGQVLVPGTYYWYVDVQGADGRSSTTGARSFTVTSPDR